MQGGTILGRIAQVDPKQAPHVFFQIRPAGKGAPQIDPKPILDGWKLLEATAGLPRLRQERALLEERRPALDRPGAAAAEAGAREARAQRPAREHLPLRPRGHPHRPDRPPRARHARVPRGVRARPDRVGAQVRSQRHDDVRQRLRALLRQRRGHRRDQRHPDPRPPGSGRHHRADRQAPDAAPGHDAAAPDHLAARPRAGTRWRCPTTGTTSTSGFHPLFGTNAKLGEQALTILKPGQWNDLIDRLKKIQNPLVPTDPSKYSIPVHPAKGKSAPTGDD